MPDRACVLCAVYRPRARPRLPEQPPVCDGDRRLLDTQLAELPDLHDRVSRPELLEAAEPAPAGSGQTPDPPDPPGRPDRPDPPGRPDPPDPPGRPDPPDPPGRSDPPDPPGRSDPLGPLGGAGPVPGRRRRPRVSGSPAPPWSPPLDRIDLTRPARPAGHRRFARDAPGLDDDQVGYLPVATVLETWARDWRDTCWPGLRLPEPRVGNLVGWLRARLPAACTSHPRIDEFAAEVRDVRSALRRVLGEPDPLPQTEPYAHLPCPECDLRGVLLRRPADPYIECGACGALLTSDELPAPPA